MTFTVMETLRSMIGSDNVIIKFVLISEDDETLFETPKPVMGYKIFKMVPEELQNKTVAFTQLRWVNGDLMLYMAVRDDKEEAKVAEFSTLKSILSLFGDKDNKICIIRSGIGRIYSGSISGFMSSISDVYNPSILYAPVEKVYNDVDTQTKRLTFFIRIGGQYDNC